MGGGETFVAGRYESKLSVVTWNCATLFGAAPRTHEQRRRHAAKIDRVVALAGRHDVVMLQEVHGNSEDIGELASRITRHSFLVLFVATRGREGSLLSSLRSFGGGLPLAGVRRSRREERCS